MAEAERVLIVGGGVTGMQAATLLGQMGIPSILVEKSDRLGRPGTPVVPDLPLLQ